MGKETLKPFKQGEDSRRNIDGRPKGALSFKTRIKRWLEAELEEENPETGSREKMPLLDIIILAQIKKARRGNDRSFELLKDHMEAKPKQGLDVTSAGEKISQTEVIFRDYSGKKK